MTVKAYEFGRRGETVGQFLNNVRELLPGEAETVSFVEVPPSERAKRIRTYREAVSREQRFGFKAFMTLTRNFVMVVTRVR